MHIPWDDAGCLCPVGDFYNYAAPGEEPCGWEDLKDAEQDDVLSQRLTDGGYKEDLAAYCFYARKNYKKGEQVLLTFLIS
uniref:SET domain-containing protein n=1 Tax=Vitis vinifera TaxID=29760 RepID=F6HFX2_VITVI